MNLMARRASLSNGLLTLAVAVMVQAHFLTAARADDTADLQSQVTTAIANHQTLFLKPKRYIVSSTIVFAPPPGSKFLTIIMTGAGTGNSVISWAGPSNQSVFQFTSAKSSVLQGFQIGGGPAVASLDFAGGGSSSNVELRNLLVDNPAAFSVRLGNPNDFSQVSEFAFHNVKVSRATLASFELEGNNTLNTNFYDCTCENANICVNNRGALETRLGGPGSQDGSNFNWFGGSVAATPFGQTDPEAATFVMNWGAVYNFVGVRVESSSTVLYAPGPTGAPIDINWLGNRVGMGSDPANLNARVIKYYAGGIFHSQGSYWEAKGTFDFPFNTLTQLAVFEDDHFSIHCDANRTVQDYFAGIPTTTRLKRVDIFPAVCRSRP